jgi:uncharacterized protein YggE
MRPALLFVPLALVGALAMPVSAMAQDFRGGSIQIEGRGEVSAAPDMAFVNSGVTTQGKTAREALDANTAAMNQLIETLKASGIEARDIQTSGFSVQPNYVYTDARDANGYTLPPKIDGYTVYNNVTVRVRDISKLGSVLDQSVTVGANTVSGVTFAVADPTKLYDEARTKAFADALRKARIYGDAARVDLDRIISIVEAQPVNGPQPYLMREFAADQAASAPVPVEAGELTFAINVSVTWSID